MKIVIENTEFAYDLGCRLLKLKHETCPFKELESVWGKIKPLTFSGIARLENLEQRRVAIICLGIDRLIKEVNPKLINSKTIKKTTTFVDKDGKLIEKKFNDTYELFEVEGSYFSKGLKNFQQMENCYFVKCKDTSTNRVYLIWVDIKRVSETNGGQRWNVDVKKINAIQCIAWTIQTTVEEGNIEKILRQGDCILIKPKNASAKMLETPRHLTEKEYRKLLVAES